MANNRATSLHRIAAARGNTRFMRVAGPVFAGLGALVLLAACATTQPCTSRTEIRRVSVPVFIDLPAEFTEPLDVPEMPDDLSNRDLEADNAALGSIIDRCQDHRAEIWRRQQQRREGQGNDE